MGDKGDASVARHVDNKIRPLPPEEYIVLIGGCTNTFNGWNSFVLDPKSNESTWDPMPAPHSMIEVTYMLKTPQAVDLDKIDKKEWNKYGWSEYGANEVKSKGLNAKDLKPGHPGTHDLYWANFVDPATRLFLKDSALSAPHVRPKPRKGDIVTYFIYQPAYKKRAKVDWRASPYNIAHREKYIDPKTNPQAAAWWHSPVPSAPINLPPVKPGHVTRTVQDEQAIKKREEADKKAREADKYRKLDEDDINFHILMSTTGENTDKAIKRPKFEGHYMEYLRGDMGDGPLGSAYHFGALTKIFFFSRVAELVQYLQTGKWEGKEWDGGADEDESGNKKNCVYSPGRPVRKDIYNRPLKVTTPWYKAWDKTPSVDRNLVKVRRFDYFGHSDAENMILLYGWNNEKGEPPDYDHVLTIDGLEKCFQGKVLTHDAVAALWGCNLGANMEDGSPGIAPRLAEKFFPGGAVAADQRTSFDHILDNDYAMPEPMPDYVWDAAKNAWVEAKGTWKFYPHKKGKAAGTK